jgi:hypothetical protein
MWWRRVRYLLLLLALCSIATCPTAKRSCTGKARAREAEQLLEYLGDRVAAALVADKRVPRVAVGPTPAIGACCEQGGMCGADPALWDVPGWKALAFSVDGEFRYSYEYVPAADGQSAIVRATGDTDCHGDAAVYELEIKRDADGATRTWTRTNPYD